MSASSSAGAVRASTTPRRAPARVALQARPVPHQREVAAFAGRPRLRSPSSGPRCACRRRSGARRLMEGGARRGGRAGPSPARRIGANSPFSAVAPSVEIAAAAAGSASGGPVCRARGRFETTCARGRCRRRAAAGRLAGRDSSSPLADHRRCRSRSGRHGRGRCGRDRRSRARGRRSRGSRSRS